MPLFITYSQSSPSTESTPTQKSLQVTTGASDGSPTVPCTIRPCDTLPLR